MTKRRTSRPQVDWLMVRAAFESGQLSDRSLAREYCVTPRAIRYRRAKEDWRKPPAPTRDDRDAPAGAAPLPQPEAPATAPIEISVSPTLADAAAADPKAIVERGRHLAGRLLDELDVTSSHVGELEELIEAETAGDVDGRRRAAMMRAIALPTRAAVLKNLALASKTLAEIGAGKKADAGGATKSATPSRFSTPAPPRLVVNNK